MARCSRCKVVQTRYPLRPLHKRKGAVFCESCLGIGRRIRPGGWFISGFWDLVDWVHDTLGRFWERAKGVKKVKLDVGDKKFQAAKNFAMRPRMVKVVRIGGGYQKTA